MESTVQLFAFIVDQKRVKLAVSAEQTMNEQDGLLRLVGCLITYSTALPLQSENSLYARNFTEENRDG